MEKITPILVKPFLNRHRRFGYTVRVGASEVGYLFGERNHEPVRGCEDMTIHRGAEQFLMRSHHVVGPSPGKRGNRPSSIFDAGNFTGYATTQELAPGWRVPNPVSS